MAALGALDFMEIVNTRTFDTPREQLFDAFINPAHLAQWWGPAGFTNAFHEFDPHPGGAWRFTMRGPDGQSYEMNKKFLEVVRPERIVLRHEQANHNFTMTMTFADQAGKTLVTWRMLFEEPAEEIRKVIEEANEQNFDRLEAHLKEPTSGPH